MSSYTDPELRWLVASQKELHVCFRDDHAKCVMGSRLRNDLIGYLEDKNLLDIDWDDLSEEQRAIISDACYDALCNDAPVVFEYELEQDFGPYPAHIRGVPGCYFLDITERDPIGPFATLDLAKKAFEFGFGNLISDSSE